MALSSPEAGSIQISQQIINIKKTETRTMIERQAHDTTPDFEKSYEYYRYLMEEYPSRLCSPAFSHSKSFANTRVRSLNLTNVYYWLIIFLFIVQLGIMIFCFCGFHATRISFHWTDPAYKVIGFSLCLASFSAWKKQLWKDEEFYGESLAQTSKDEPIYVVLKNMKINQYDAQLIIGDWLKNRPSVTFLLAVSLCTINVFHFFPDFAASSDRLLLQLIVSLLAFLFCFPLVTDWRYFADKHDGIKIKEKLSAIVTIFFTAIVLFLILFSLPIAITFIAPAVLAFFGILFVALLIFVVLFLYFRHKKRKRCPSEPRNFKNWSCAQQIEYLNTLASDSSLRYETISEFNKSADSKDKTDPQPFFEHLANGANSAQVLDMIMDLYYSLHASHISQTDTQNDNGQNSDSSPTALLDPPS